LLSGESLTELTFTPLISLKFTAADRPTGIWPLPSVGQQQSLGADFPLQITIFQGLIDSVFVWHMRDSPTAPRAASDLLFALGLYRRSAPSLPPG
jgi:hypothetical protein